MNYATNTNGPDEGAARKTEERIDMSTVPQEPKTPAECRQILSDLREKRTRKIAEAEALMRRAIAAGFTELADEFPEFASPKGGAA